MQIIMPKLGLTMTHGTITEWLKAPGDTVEAEEALLAYETEKVTLEIAAPEDGVLAEILAPAADDRAHGRGGVWFVTGDEGRRTKDGGRGTGVRSQGSGVGRSGRGRAILELRIQLQPPPPSPLTATPKARVLARGPASI